MFTGEKVFPKVLIVSIFKDMWKQPEKSAVACEKAREEELQQTGSSVAGAKCRYSRESSSRLTSLLVCSKCAAVFDLQEHLYANNANRIDFYAPKSVMNINTLWCSWGLNKLLMSFSSLLLHFDFPPFIF